MKSKLCKCLVAFAMLLGVMTGCLARNGGKSATKPVNAVSNARSGSLDTPLATQIIFNVDVWVLFVPYGSLSRNEEFWKRIDENALDPATYDLLYRSGIRVGEAPRSELSLLGQYMEGVIPRQRRSVQGTEVKNMLIEMKSDIPDQDIFHFSKQNEPIGRRYEDSDNFISISFEPALRKQGQLRLSCCPMVRSKTSYQRATMMNQMYTITRETPEVLYDLNFKVDLSGENFLIAMPSPDVTATNVGGAFFTKDGASERMEQVLLILCVPHEVQMSRPTP